MNRFILFTLSILFPLLFNNCSTNHPPLSEIPEISPKGVVMAKLDDEKLNTLLSEKRLNTIMSVYYDNDAFYDNDMEIKGSEVVYVEESDMYMVISKGVDKESHRTIGVKLIREGAALVLPFTPSCIYSASSNKANPCSDCELAISKPCSSASGLCISEGACDISVTFDDDFMDVDRLRHFQTYFSEAGL